MVGWAISPGVCVWKVMCSVCAVDSVRTITAGSSAFGTCWQCDYIDTSRDTYTHSLGLCHADKVSTARVRSE